MGEKYEKIKESEIVIGIMLGFGVYLICFALDSIVLGAFISPIIQGFFTFLMWNFFKGKGDPHANKLGPNIAQYSANLIPFVPAVVASFIIKVVVHNHQELVGTAVKVAKVALTK